jgi:transcriptional regulator with XRE-family HTH domain
LRERAGLTVEMLAVAAAVSKGDLSRLEHGMKPPPSIVVLLRLSEALGPGVAEWRSTCS